jgi:DNA-binding response OmpR family regulator
MTARRPGGPLPPPEAPRADGPAEVAGPLAAAAATTTATATTAATAPVAVTASAVTVGAAATAASGCSELQFGDLNIDLASRTVARGGHPVKLTHLEFELLSFFCRNTRRVFSREELVREVWGLRQVGPARTVDNFVAQLRAKLEQDPEAPRHLLTVRGSGYRFTPD